MGLLLAVARSETAIKVAASTALLDRLPGAGAFEIFLLYSKLTEDYRFGRAHDGRPAAPWAGMIWSNRRASQPKPDATRHRLSGAEAR